MATALAASTPTVDPTKILAPAAEQVGIPLDQVDPKDLEPMPVQGIPLDEVDPAALQTEDEYLGALTRKQLRQKAVEAYMAGNTRPEDLQKFKNAYIARAREMSIIDEDRTPEAAKPVQDQIAAVDTGSPVVDFLGRVAQKVTPDGVTRTGQAMFEGLFTQLNEAGKALTGANLMAGQPVSRAESDMAGENIIAAAKLNALRSADMIRTFTERVANRVLFDGKQDDPAWVDRSFGNQFETDLALGLAEEGLKQGSTMHGADRQTDPTTVETVSQSPLSDPSMAIPMSGAAQIGHGASVAARAVGQGEKSVAELVAQAAGKAAARPLEVAAKYAEKVGQTVDNSPILKGLAAAGAVDAFGGSKEADVLAAFLGAKAKIGLFSGAARGLTSVAGKLAGKVPNGPLGNFAVQTMRVLGPEIDHAVLGQLSNLPLALGAGDEDSFKGMIEGGLIAHSGTRAIGATINGLSINRNLWKPSSRSIPEERMNVQDHGDEALDVAHRAVASTLDNADNNYVESVRKAVRKFTKNEGELYVAGEKDFADNLDRMVKEGGWSMLPREGEPPIPLTQDVADLTKRQQGVTLQRVDPQTGKVRKVAFNQIKAGMPALSVGHEATHLLESVISPEEKRFAFDEILRSYGGDQVYEYWKRYQDLVDPSRDTSKDPESFDKMSPLQVEQTLSEIFAEHGNAVLNSVPIGKFSDPKVASKDMLRAIYGVMGRALERIGAKQPKLVDGVADIKTGTGIEPSANLAKVVENFFTAKTLDGDVTGEIAGAVTKADAKPPIQEWQKTIAGKPDAAAAPNPDVVRSPITDKSPVGAKALTPEDVVAPKQVENTTRPEAPAAEADSEAAPAKRNIRVTERQQDEFGNATPELQRQNTAVLDERFARPRHEQTPVTIDYNSAKTDEFKPDQATRELQRQAADAAEKAAQAEGKPNPLRGVVDKMTVPFAWDKQSEKTRILAWSSDKVIANLDLLRGWAEMNPAAKKIIDMAYLTGPEIARDLVNYMENLSHGFKGDGTPIKATPDAYKGSVTPTDPNFTPHVIPQDRVNHLNLLQGLQQDATTARGMVFARRMAEYNGREIFRSGDVQDPNPLRGRLRAELGFPVGHGRLLESAIEKLNVDRIVSPITDRSDRPFRAGDTAGVQAGFMPAVHQTETPEFKQWFGDSKTVDRYGRPRPMYHGTSAEKDFTAFKAGNDGLIFTSPDPKFASGFSHGNPERGDRPRVYKVWVKSENPFDYSNPEHIRRIFGDESYIELKRGSDASPTSDIYGSVDYDGITADRSRVEMGEYDHIEDLAHLIKKAGFDGLYVNEDGIRNLAVFEPTQIKSATGNNGKFDPTNPDIRYMPAVKPAPTGWVLPDGTYEGAGAGLGGAWMNNGDWHQGHLTTNEAKYGKKFKLPAGASREDALKRGFVRVRYDGKTGEMGVEANSKFFTGKVRARVEDVVESNLGKIDQLHVNLFNDQGKVVRETYSGPLFRMEDLEKSQAAMDVLKGKAPRDVGRYMPAVDSAGESRESRRSAIRAFYDEQARAESGTDSGAGGVVGRGAGTDPVLGQPPAVHPAGAGVGEAERVGDGRGTAAFFADVTEGKRGLQNTGKAYEPVIKSLPADAQDFAKVRAKYRGNFDNHIATSIPAFEEVQSLVGSAISKTFKDGGTMLDIGASEGALVKAISEVTHGKVETTALDPNPSMQAHFEKQPVKGSQYVTDAFGTKADEGKEAWEGVRYFDPKGKQYDVVHEAMVFQFLDGNRDLHVRRMKELTAPDGIAVVEEKVLNHPKIWDKNERTKDAYKSQYYTPDEMERKRQDVLQGKGDKAEGMNSKMVPAWDLEGALADNYAHVAQIWDSGNFKGYAASDSPTRLREFLDNLGSTHSEHSTVETPRDVVGRFMPATPELHQEFENVRKTAGNGVTLDRNGKVDTSSHLPIIVTLGSMNQDAQTATLRKAVNFFNRHQELLGTENARAGLFHFDGKISADLNVALPPERRALAEQFARDNNQNSIFDVSTMSVIETGGSGDTVLKTPAEFKVASQLLADGTYQSIQQVKDIAAGLKGTKTGTLPNLDLGKSIKKGIGKARNEVNGPLSEARVKEITKALEAEHAAEKVDLPVIELSPNKEDRVPVDPKSPEAWDEVNAKAKAALKVTEKDPALGLSEFGYRRAFAEAGLKTTVPPAPERFAQWVADPSRFAKFLEDAQAKNPELIKSALSGLEHVKKMHALARAGKLEPETVAMHMAWGIASRMLAPFDQEGGWIRVTRSPEFLNAIVDSVEGTFSMSKDRWKEVVGKAMADSNLNTTDEKASKVGKNATANLNAFHGMLKKWNGRWGELTDILNNAELTGPQMREEFFKRGFGGAGIKHKVASFVILTLARADVFIADRWQIIQGNLPALERISKEKGFDSPFKYDKKGTPEDRTGSYGTYGPLLDKPSVASVFYPLVERGFTKIGSDPSVAKVFNRPLEASEIHWLSWNIIKNEPVGHSSLEVTHNLLAEGKTLRKLGREGLVNEVVTQPARTQRFNNRTKLFDEFTVQDKRAVLRPAANQ